MELNWIFFFLLDIVFLWLRLRLYFLLFGRCDMGLFFLCFHILYCNFFVLFLLYMIGLVNRLVLILLCLLSLLMLYLLMLHNLILHFDTFLLFIWVSASKINSSNVSLSVPNIILFTFNLFSISMAPLANISDDWVAYTNGNSTTRST